MIIAAFTLDWLDDDGADVDLMFVDASMDFFLRFFLARDHVFFALGFRQRKIDVRSGNTWPVELGEQICLPRVGVGLAHGVAAATVKGVTKMQNLRSALTLTRGHVLADFPIHRRFERVLDRECAAFDEEIFFEWWQS